IRTIRAPYTAVFRTFAGSRSAGIKTHASNPCCADCAATAFARFPVEEHPTVWKLNRLTAARAVPTTRSLKDREGKHTASFLMNSCCTPHLSDKCRDATSG